MGPAGLPEAGRPGDHAIWHRPSSGWLGLSPGVGCELFSIFHMILRLVGLAMAHLGPQLLYHAVQGLYVVPQVGLGTGCLVCHWKLTQLDLVYAFRSLLVTLMHDTCSLLDLVFRTITEELHGESPWG